MWPFKKSPASLPKALTVERALAELASLGVHLSPDCTIDDILYSTGGQVGDVITPVEIMCLMGGEGEREPFMPLSTDIWHFDAECINDSGDYTELAKRFISLSKGAIRATEINDHVDILAGEAWLELVIDGQRMHWDLEVSDDWMAPALYTNMQSLVRSKNTKYSFMIVALGQDSLVAFGDDQKRKSLGAFLGHEFQWQ